MTDIALSSFGKPLSMTPAAIRKRDYRARRDKQGANLSQAGPSRATRDKPPKRNGHVVPFSGRHMSHAVTNKDNQMLNGQDMSHVSTPMSHGLAPSLVPGQETAQPSVHQVPSVPVPSDGMIVTLRVLGVLALIGSLGTNGTFLISQSNTIAEAVVMGIAVLVYDGAVALIPRAGTRLFRERHIIHAIISFGIWAICVTIAAVAAAGFAGTNIGGAAAERGSAAIERTGVEADLAKARADRDALRGKFSPTSQAQVDTAEEVKDEACNTGNKKFKQSVCEQKRTDLKSVSRDRETQLAADRLDDKITRLDGRLSNLPVGKSVNPQAETAVMLIATASRGAITLDPREPLAMQYFGFIFLPMLAGFIFAWVELLSEKRGEPKPQREVTVLRSSARRPSLDSNQTEVAFA